MEIITDEQDKTDISEFLGRFVHKPCIKIAQPRIDKRLCALCGKNKIYFSYNCRECGDNPNRIGF